MGISGKMLFFSDRLRGKTSFSPGELAKIGISYRKKYIDTVEAIYELGYMAPDEVCAFRNAHSQFIEENSVELRESVSNCGAFIVSSKNYFAKKSFFSQIRNKNDSGIRTYLDKLEDSFRKTKLTEGYNSFLKLDSLLRPRIEASERFYELLADFLDSALHHFMGIANLFTQCELIEEIGNVSLSQNFRKNPLVTDVYNLEYLINNGDPDKLFSVVSSYAVKNRKI